jgi:hypothetical protein
LDHELEQRDNTSDYPRNEERHTVRILPDDAERGVSEPAKSYLPYDTQVIQPAPGEPAAPAVQQNAKPAPTGRPLSSCSIMVITFGVLALACLILTYATIQGGLGGLDKLTGIIPSISLPLRTPTVTIDTSRPSVVEQVRALSKLETVHYQMEKVISGNSEGPLPDFLTSDRILLVAHGEVVGGVDFSKINSEEIEVEDGSVTITLPEPEVLYSKLDNSRTYVYDRQTGLFSKPDPNLESQLRAEAEEQIVQAAIEDGILLKASDNAQETLRTLLEGLGYDEVQFEETK